MKKIQNKKFKAKIAGSGKKHAHARGFTLIETVVSIGIFAVLVSGIFGIYSTLTKGVKAYREQTAISSLADQYMEIARNLPYSQIGTLSGNPHGNLVDQPNAVQVLLNGNTYKIYYVVNNIFDSSDGASIPEADYKQIKMYVKNVTTGVSQSFVTTVTPKGLEGLGSGGALSIKVFNAVGQPVPDASIQITNTTVVPNINLTRTSDASGNWIEVGLPNSVNSYHVVVTKNGYSSDQTYPSTGPNPNPTKPDATIANGQVTQVSFAIDQLSNLIFNTQDQTCLPISNVGVEVRGAKLIGTNPNIIKYDNTFNSNILGQISLNNIEWDTYTPALTGNNYMIYGSSPIQQINMLPNTNQNFALILGPKTNYSLLVIVKDAATGNPIENANVDLQTISPASDTNKLTGGSIWSQQDWSGGFGQSNFTDPTKYFSDDGNISNNVAPIALRLLKTAGVYASAGSLISSTFDSGTALTGYTTLTWQPTSQDPATSIKFQIATNNDNLIWNYIGPDGTSNTYYTVPATTISILNNNNRYVRYKVFLATTDTSKTPVLTSVNINYVSGCFTPGQVIFPGLQAGSNYNVVVSMTGYQNQTINNVNINGYNTLQVLLSH